MYPGVFAPNDAFPQAPAQKLLGAGPAAEQCPTPQGVSWTEGLERRGSRGWKEGRDVSFPEVGLRGERQFHRIAGVEGPGVSSPRGLGSGVVGKRGATKEAQRHRAQEPAE